MIAVYAWAFLLLGPAVVAAARYTFRLRREDPSGLATALAVVTITGATIAAFLAWLSALVLLGGGELVALFSPGVLPSFLVLELLIVVIPVYLRRLNKGGQS